MCRSSGPRIHQRPWVSHQRALTILSPLRIKLSAPIGLKCAHCHPVHLVPSYVTSSATIHFQLSLSKYISLHCAPIFIRWPSLIPPSTGIRPNIQFKRHLPASNYSISNAICWQKILKLTENLKMASFFVCGDVNFIRIKWWLTTPSIKWWLTTPSIELATQVRNFGCDMKSNGSWMRGLFLRFIEQYLPTCFGKHFCHLSTTGNVSILGGGRGAGRWIHPAILTASLSQRHFRPAGEGIWIFSD